MTTLTLQDLYPTQDELLSRRMAKWVYHGPGVLAAWVADMDFRAAPPITEIMRRLVDESDFGYGMRRGKTPGEALADAFVSRVAHRFAWQVDPDRVQPLTDLVQGMFDAVLTFSEPGDGVIVQGPHYDPFREAIIDSGREMVVNHMVRTDDGWRLDLEDLDRVARTSSILFFCHPQNPTGRAYTLEELRAVGEIAVEHDLVVVSDEIWSDMYHVTQPHIPFASFDEEVAKRTITMYSAGKTFSLAGVRGAIMHFGSEELERQFHDRFPPRSLGGLNVFGVDATIAAWEQGAEWYDLLMTQLAINRDRVTQWVNEIGDEITGIPPEATYLYWLDCSGLELGASTPFEFFLSEAKVALSPGAGFGERYSNYARINFATSPDVLDEVLDRLKGAIDAR